MRFAACMALTPRTAGQETDNGDTMENIIYATAIDTARSIAEGKVSAVEVLQAHFARIDATNPTMNAVVWQDRDAALAEARACDAETARGESRGALHGVPVTVKESFDIAGAPTTWGIPEWADNIAETDSDVVQRYRAAGAVVFGKTNVPLKLVEWQSFNAVYGSTSNPWDTTRTPGGSSGGSAAALASGMSALEAGSDIGSSIRNPAHYCGVFGLKPTWGVVSKDGHKSKGWYPDTDIAVAGPLARSADDLTLAFDLLKGPSRFEASQWAPSLRPDNRTRLSEFRVALMLGDPAVQVDNAYLDALSGFADRLEAAGATVIRDRIPEIDTEAHFMLYLKLLGAAMSGGISDAEAAAIIAPFADQPADVQRVFGTRVSGLAISHREWLDLHNRRLAARLAFDAFFEDVDILLAPVCAGPAFPKNEEGPRYSRRIQINGEQVLETEQLFWSGYSGVVGIPSAVGPMDRIGGLPVGYQAIAGHGRDYTALAFARAAEAEFGGFTPPPALG
jgi:amidase